MRRILFVDDEQQILDGLRALLRPKRNVWETVFVGSGKEALEALEKSSFDVVVSDMKMPEMDGATLLHHVQARYPGVVRIVLSGHAELEAALRAVPVAHQFLLKPCDPQLLESVVQRACDLQALVSNEGVRKFVGGLQSLPPLPEIYVRLTKLLESEDSGVAEIARVIEQDPAMCAKVLQLVNSSFIGLGRTISDVEQAIRYLGLNLLKSLTLAAQVFHIRNLDSAQQQRVLRLQRHGLLVGGLARRFAGPDQRASDDAFMAGILHDIGKLVMIEHKADTYDLVQKMARLSRRPAHEVEFELMGVTHSEVGAFLLGIWGLPYPIVQAAASHHAPGLVHSPSRDVLLAVHAANALAHEQEEALGMEEPSGVPLDEAYLAAAGASGCLEEWRAIAAEQVSESRREQGGGQAGAMAA